MPKWKIREIELYDPPRRDEIPPLDEVLAAVAYDRAIERDAKWKANKHQQREAREYKHGSMRRANTARQQFGWSAGQEAAARRERRRIFWIGIIPVLIMLACVVGVIVYKF